MMLGVWLTSESLRCPSSLDTWEGAYIRTEVHHASAHGQTYNNLGPQNFKGSTSKTDRRGGSSKKLSVFLPQCSRTVCTSLKAGCTVFQPCVRH